MDDLLCQRFFAKPKQTLHRHFEILRAHFLEHRPLQTLAEQFRLNYYTVRSLVRRFRAQCQANQVPPFLSTYLVDGLDSSRLLREPNRSQHLLLPTVGN